VATKVAEVDEALIDSVCTRLREQLSDGEAEQAETFVRQYYRWVSPDDIAERSQLDLYGAALAHFNLARTRKPGTPNVRVYNPRFEVHGWQSTHTTVEIVTDDMPFVTDSISMELNRRGFDVHLVIHPVMQVRRDDNGALKEIAPLHPQNGEPPADFQAESIIHAEVARQTDANELEQLTQHLERVMREVRAAVEDWRPMRETALEIATQLETDPPPLERDDVNEARAFLVWLEAHNFTFLGYRDYDVLEDDGDVRLASVEGSGLGILRQPEGTSTSHGFDKLPPGVRARALEPYLLNLTKANSRATIHRPSYLDYVGVKRFDENGKVIGERRFLGLYNHTAYHASPSEIPVLRRKVDAVLQRAAFPPDSHNWKALIEILDTHPRDELFEVSPDELFEIAMGILYLGDRHRVRLFVRRDPFGRYLSCLVFVPRDRFNTENRKRIQQILTDAFGATNIEYTTRVSESVLVRLHYMVYTEPGDRPDPETRDVERRIVAATRLWVDDLEDALTDEHGEETGNSLHRLYGDAFPTAYRVDWPARSAVADIRHIEELDHEDLSMVLYAPLEAPPNTLRAKVFRTGTPLALSDMLPVFESLGVDVADERPYQLTPRDRPPAWIYDFGLSCPGGTPFDADRDGPAFQDAFIRIWRGDVESDKYNRLVLQARLRWREITVLRAIARYLRQAGTTFSDHYLEDALIAHPKIAKLLVDLFRTRFDPANTDRDKAEQLVEQITAEIDAVESLDQDRILRNFLNGVQAMLRTNYFQRDKLYLSFKLDPSKLPLLPKPLPQFEIFVYSPRVEGVHLRGGKVARGGIRWSDRREDFRTEVLGLMKAQMVKNAVIVPVGAKGGFVVKRPPSRETLQQEVEACYSTFIRGLLDLSDSIGDDGVIPPPDVVRYDDDDPYLVVAADKGTATLSDVANAIAKEYGFWLGDAFASGGETGYDHKKMGITARGAWESVKRHFRELGHDVQREDFTVIGIGDMSGDVFGNGMLLSRHIRLIGAFNHREIFIDPNPDSAVSYEERKRLFETPGSSWADYSKGLISPGGGVYPRRAKAIPITDELREAFGIEDEAETMTPAELIRTMLKAPADLLWNGGIGTYAKASHETHGDAGDKANDIVRVDASQLRCRVIGEGGNLGLTQAARIEFALWGGHVNTDAIDNSAGVDCSDHEVNIKVLLDAVVADGDMTSKQRNELLAEMTDEVGASCLTHNYEQTETLTLGETQAEGMLDVHARLIHSYEAAGKLDRALEGLPDDESLAERKREHEGLTRPELSVLLAYTKIDLYRELLDSGVPEDPYLSAELQAYFPKPLQERFAEQMREHPLRREITATQVVNHMLHGGGTTFVFRLHEETGAPASDIARAYTVARETYRMRKLAADVAALDNKIEASVQAEMMLQARRLMERGTRWLLRNVARPLDIAATVERFGPHAARLYEGLPKLLGPDDAEPLARRADALQEQGVPPELALRVAALAPLFAVFDIVEVMEETGLDVEEVAEVHFRIGSSLELGWLREAIVALPREDRWAALARSALRDDLFSLQRSLTAEVLRNAPPGDAAERVEAWVESNPASERTRATLADIRVGHVYDLTTLPVAVREVRNLIQAPAVGPPVAAREGASS
jgi:glutamate dehydrogenase